MSIKNYYLLIFSLLIVTVKWSSSFYFFPESIETKILHDSVGDAKYYYPLIKFLSELNLNYSFDPEITNLKIVPLPFWGIIFHSISLKFFGFYSFIFLDFLCVFIILLIFFHIFNISFNKEIAVILSILIFLLPYLISNTFLGKIQYFYLFGETLYNLRVPRPMITNLYFFSFILLSLKLVTGKFYEYKNFFLLGLIMALSLSSFYFHFFTEAAFLLILLIYKFQFKIFIEFKDNFKYYFILTITFFLISVPFFLNLYFHETDYTYRQCVFNLDWDIKIKVLQYLFNKYFSLNGIIFISGISFLTLIANKANLINNLDKRVINTFYTFFLASLIGPIIFILIAPKACVIYHVINFIILNAFMFLIIYSLIVCKLFFKFKFTNYMNLTLIFLSILFLSFQEINKKQSKKDNSNHTEYRNELNLVTKKIEENYALEEISLLTFEENFMIWSILNNIKYLDLNKAIFTSKKDLMIEEDIFSAFRKLGLNEKNFELFIQNRKTEWRYMNPNITGFVYYKYQANPLMTYQNSLDFEKEELDHIKKTHLLLQQQQMIPKFELSRLKKEFRKFDGDLIYPEIIVLNKNDDFFDYKNLNLNEYCNVFDGKVFVLYFKDKNELCVKK